MIRRQPFGAWILALIVSIAACEDAVDDGGVTVLEPIQPVIQADSPTLAIGGTSQQLLAQTLRIVRSATLTGVYLPVGCSSGELEIEIRDVAGAEPGSTILAHRSVPAASIVTDVQVFRFFDLPRTTVSTGDRLTLVLRNTEGTCGMGSAPPGNPYTDGEAFFDARPNPPGWVRLHGRGVEDLAFQIRLELQ